MSAIVLRNELVHYEVLGRGRPVVFLHGWVGSWRYWIPVMQTLSTTFRTYALDFWGFGDTTKSPDRYRVGQQVSLLEDFLNELGIGKVALIGHGLGAVIACIYTAMVPEKVDRLLAVSLPLRMKQIAEKLRTNSPSDLADWLLGRTLAHEAVRLEAQKTDVQAIRTFLEDMEFLDLVQVTHTLKTPSLLVHGRNDPAVALMAEADNVGLPEMTHSIEFEGCGHFPMLDEAEKFNRLVADFFNLGSDESPRQLQLKETWKRRVR